MMTAARETIEQDATAQALVPPTTWTAIAGYVGCPNRHVIPMDSKYCEKCGAGPVPDLVAWAAHDAAGRLGAMAGLNDLRQLGWVGP